MACNRQAYRAVALPEANRRCSTTTQADIKSNLARGHLLGLLLVLA